MEEPEAFAAPEPRNGNAARVPALVARAQHWRADPAVIPVARRAIVAGLRDAGVSDGSLIDIELALSEALTNVSVHAYRHDAAPGEMRVETGIADGVLLVVVEDDGCGWRPRGDSPGLGLGLGIIASVTERFERRRSVTGGTRLCLYFALT